MDQLAAFRSLRESGIPNDLKGKSVIDIGGYDGHFLQLAVDRGAASATCIDNEQWRSYGWPAPVTTQGVEYANGDLSSWSEPADLVICYNVLYHFRDVYGACAKLRHLTKWQLSLCTSFVDGPDNFWKFFPQKDWAVQQVVYWKPTISGLCTMLWTVGFAPEVVGTAGDHVLVTAT